MDKYRVALTVEERLALEQVVSARQSSGPEADPCAHFSVGG